MSDILKKYGEVIGFHAMDSLLAIAERLEGKKIVHINSTKEGGGVAEILSSMVPLSQELGLDVAWEVIEGDEPFFNCTKTLHNSLQGMAGGLSESQAGAYMETNRKNAERLKDVLESADYVFIHDPQPAALLGLFPKRKGKWIWRCHIDVSSPNRSVWRFVKKQVEGYDASIFSLPDFAQNLPHPQYLITPSIDPLSEKNRPLTKNEVLKTYEELGIGRDKPVILQVSRFDRFKDPLGVIESYRLARDHVDIRLVLAGGGATDDPESGEVLSAVKEAAAGDPDISILLLPADAHRTINALQAGADVVMQKSTKEGFGLTVTEAMWKKKPVVGGDVGGIRLQVINRFNGFRVRSPEGAAIRIRYLLTHRWKRERMGVNARQYVLENFLITGQLRNYLSLLVSLDGNEGEWEPWI
ncbi:MAG: glycosyltransferase [Synergistales bacterium]|uniref:glycosyltransferase n=1 Tax=Aminivibrio sp. TaxID=1872489 RepID=UPI001DC1E292|nr:glycosyltransferase [Synergistaceae bacterium]MDD3390206.1 glycosyltransferase [Synergistaceae bacterium]MDD4021204.1 glycosyltransferase [Synergistaceae bacterium]MDD4611835.1 glycosyltransferase [Synergistaceae bacterium]NCC56760.1 glycosyltransferase [Synergistales bacterium]